ncbi:MAG: c-type cytochrome [Phycisphaerales bacterium]
MKQFIGLVCAGLVGSMLIAGCGGEDDGGSSSASAKKPSVNATAVKGALIFKKTCATCHGADGKGMENNGPDVTASEFIRDTSAEDLLTYVQVGREVPDGVPMPPRGGFSEAMLPDSDIEKVIVYLKNMKGNQP